MRTPNRAKAPVAGAVVLSVFLVAVCAVSSAYAVRIWTDRGPSSDAVLCIVIAAVSALCILLIILYLYRFRRTSKIAEMPVYYTMVSGPKEEEAEKPIRFKGKMPPKDR